MPRMKTERAGNAFVLGGALLWGLFPVITQLVYGAISPLPALAWADLFAAVFFAIIMTVKRQWGSFADRAVFRDILLATLFLGIFYYVLTFIGLRYTSAGNASLLGLTEIFFSYLLFNVFRGEKLPTLHLVGAILTIAGAGIVLYPNTTAFNMGDFLIVAAAAVAPFGNLFQRRARGSAPSEAILFVRCAVSSIFIFCAAYALGERMVPVFSFTVFALLAVNGIFLLGLSKIFWIEGIFRISITRANALSGITPLFTLLFAYVMLGNVPTVWQLSSFVPMFIGVLLLSVPKQQFLPR